MVPAEKHLQIGSLLFPGLDQIDLTGPFEVLSAIPNSTLRIAAKTLAPIKDFHGLTMVADKTFDEMPDLDVLHIPGGPGQQALMDDEETLSFIRKQAAKASSVLSVCTGARLLAKAELLDGLEATTHHGAIDLLRQTAPKTTVHADRRFVDNGRVICSAGIAAGIDMSLHVVGRLLNREVAEKTAKQMEYPWSVPSQATQRRKSSENNQA